MAMAACGSFPIVSEIPTNSEWIVNGFNGATLRELDASALAREIVRTLDDAELRQRVGRTNLSLVRAKGDFQAEMERVASVYEFLSSN